MNINKMIIFMLPLLSLVFLLSVLQEKFCILELTQHASAESYFYLFWLPLLCCVLTKPMQTPMQNIIKLCTVALFHQHRSTEKPEILNIC